MFRIFRHIREGLLAEKKVNRYVLYAVGEIVLVVLGIVIALQIDNWNEWRQERELEQIVLEQLKEDYESDLAQLNQKIHLRHSIIDAALYVLDATDRPGETVRDSIPLVLVNDPGAPAPQEVPYQIVRQHWERSLLVE